MSRLQQQPQQQPHGQPRGESNGESSRGDSLMVAEEILPWETGSGRQIRGRNRTQVGAQDPVPSLSPVPPLSSSPSVPKHHGGLGGVHGGALSTSGRFGDDFEL